MKSIRILAIVLIIMGFGVILTAQRLESKNTDIELSDLQSELETIFAQQRELQLLIENETERISLDTDSGLGIPISMNDVIKVTLNKDYSESENSFTDNDSEVSIINSLFNALIYK